MVALQEAAALGRPVSHYCDLGCGIGSVLMLVAWGLPGARAVGVEAQVGAGRGDAGLAVACVFAGHAGNITPHHTTPRHNTARPPPPCAPQEISVALARRSLRYNVGAGSTRVAVLRGDLREPLPPGAVPPGGFDLVTGTPPYIPQGAGSVGRRPQKEPCNLEVRGGVEDYVTAAARVLAPGGRFVVVMGLQVGGWGRARGKGRPACNALGRRFCANRRGDSLRSEPDSYPSHGLGAIASATAHRSTRPPDCARRRPQGQRRPDRVCAAAALHGLEVSRCVEVVPREGKPPLMAVYVLRWRQEGGGGTAMERFVVRDAQGRLTPDMHAARAAIGMPPAKG